MAGDIWHQSRDPESASIEIPTFRPQLIFMKYVNLTSQRSHLEALLLSKFWSELDSESFTYVL